MPTSARRPIPFIPFCHRHPYSEPNEGFSMIKLLSTCRLRVIGFRYEGGMMSVLSRVPGILFLCHSLALAAPAERKVWEYPAARALPGEIPPAVTVDSIGYTYLAGAAVAAGPGHAAGAIYIAKIDP